MKKVLIVFGTRPEAIKMAPLIHQMGPPIKTVVCFTGQHRELVVPILKMFQLKPHYSLDIMTHGQTLTHVTVSVLELFSDVLMAEEPDLVLVHGDTTTALAAAMAAYYAQIPVGHVEAGLRSGNIYEPFPEEINRKLIAGLTSIHFAPTGGNRENLIREGIEAERIYVTGNTGIDALLDIARRTGTPSSKLAFLEKWDNMVLATVHRRENHGQPLTDICQAFNLLAKSFPNVAFVIPAHPGVAGSLREKLNPLKNVFLIPAQDYPDFVWLMKRSTLILTDSGGIQEEAPALGIPVLAMRRCTERPEAVNAGSVMLVGSKTNDIVRETTNLLLCPDVRKIMASGGCPFGDGKASSRIYEALTGFLNLTN